jgi:hypothetical protein
VPGWDAGGMQACAALSRMRSLGAPRLARTIIHPSCCWGACRPWLPSVGAGSRFADCLRRRRRRESVCGRQGREGREWRVFAARYIRQHHALNPKALGFRCWRRRAPVWPCWSSVSGCQLTVNKHATYLSSSH